MNKAQERRAEIDRLLIRTRSERYDIPETELTPAATASYTKLLQKLPEALSSYMSVAQKVGSVSHRLVRYTSKSPVSGT